MNPHKEAKFVSLHECQECKTIWRRWVDGIWGLANAAQNPGKCCDNSVDFLSKILPAADEKIYSIDDTEAMCAVACAAVKRMLSSEPSNEGGEARPRPVAWAIKHEGEYTANIYPMAPTAAAVKADLDRRFPSEQRELVPLYAAPPAALGQEGGKGAEEMREAAAVVCDIQRLHAKICEPARGAKESAETCEMLAKAIRALPLPAREAAQWIAVTERLPEEASMKRWQSGDFGEVLFYNGLGMFVGFYYRGGWYTGDFHQAECNEEWVDDVTHWMPLPSAPESEANNSTGKREGGEK